MFCFLFQSPIDWESLIRNRCFLNVFATYLNTIGNNFSWRRLEGGSGARENVVGSDIFVHPVECKSHYRWSKANFRICWMSWEECCRGRIQITSLLASCTSSKVADMLKRWLLSSNRVLRPLVPMTCYLIQICPLLRFMNSYPPFYIIYDRYTIAPINVGFLRIDFFLVSFA